jgi:hypothetical protein
METTTKSKTLFKVIALDETEHWTNDIASLCGKIETVYLYDAGVVTYPCSLTACYALTPLYYITENETDDSMDELLMNTFNEVETEVRYIAVTDIHKLEDKVECEFVGHDIEVDDFDGEEYREHFAEVEEYCKCNHQI